MRLTDELKVARGKVERAMHEQSLRDEVRCVGAGARYGMNRPKNPPNGGSSTTVGAPKQVGT